MVCEGDTGSMLQLPVSLGDLEDSVCQHFLSETRPIFPSSLVYN